MTLALTLKASPTDRNPSMPDSDDMDHWSCRIGYGRRSMTIIFSMGRGLGGKAPTLREVMHCLYLDTQGVVNQSFRDWCANYGYDEDSRRAERIYNAIHDQDARLRRLLGNDYSEVMAAFADE